MAQAPSDDAAYERIWDLDASDDRYPLLDDHETEAIEEGLGGAPDVRGHPDYTQPRFKLQHGD